MLKKNMLKPIKHKMIMIVSLFFLFGVIADIGLIEIYKTTLFQRIERNYLENFMYVEIILNKLQLQQHKDKDEKDQIARNYIEKEDEKPNNQGIVQHLKQMKACVPVFFSLTNTVEEFFFRKLGFSGLFDLAHRALKENDVMSDIVENFLKRDITYNQLINKLYQQMDTTRDLHSIFATDVSKASNMFKNIVIAAVSSIMLLIIAIAVIAYRQVISSINEIKAKLKSSSNQLKVNSENQLKAVSEQNIATVEISAVMQELVNVTKQVLDNTSQATKLSTDTGDAVDKGKISLEKALQGINIIKEKVETIMTNMLLLGEKSKQIKIVLDVINELSQQVTVLSYNATIEAAGAGDAGKRFMAVADRIIKLAERSVGFAKDIKIVIDDISSDSQKTILSTQNGKKAVDEGVIFAAHIKTSLEDIEKYAQNTHGMLTGICDSLNQQANGVEQAAVGVENISQQANETKKHSNLVMQTAKNMTVLVHKLEKL